MKVVFKGLKNHGHYRGYTFSPDEPRDVSDEWFANCKNPNIVEHKRRGRPPNVVIEVPTAIEVPGVEDVGTE